MKKSIDKTESLQDYRDRLLRYRVIYVERYLLLRALSEKERARREVSFPENDLFYREIESNHLTANEMRLYNLVNSVNKEIELTIKDLAIAFIYSLAFKFFWFFHSFFKSSIFYDFPSTNYAKEIIGLKHCHVDLTSNVIDFNGEPTEVQIEAGLARDRVDYHTNVMNYNRSDILFSIVNSTTGECIGRLIIERSKNVKEELKIVLDLVRFKNRNKSPSLNMMLLQLAMEIFSREPQRKLNLGINSCNSCVLSVSGVFHDTKLRNQVLKERQAKKVLFPEGDFINGSCTIIKNSDDSHKTKFCSLNAGNINRNPMVVEFSLDGTSNTWEEIIEKKPLLKGGSNRILWEFLGEDLSKLNDF